MSIFAKPHTLISEEGSIGAFQSQAEIQYQFVNLSLGELCPVTIVYPTPEGKFMRIETLRAKDFNTCLYSADPRTSNSNCDNLCINISKCLDRISFGEDSQCLSEILNEQHEFCRIDNNCEYLEFTCPISGLLKFAFPIKFNSQLICVVFIGQYRISKRVEILGESPNIPTYLSAKRQFASRECLMSYISSTIIPEIKEFQDITALNFAKKEKEELSKILSESDMRLGKSMFEVLGYNKDSDLESFSTSVLKLFWEKVRTAYACFFHELGANKVTVYIDDDFIKNSRSTKYLHGIDIFSRANYYHTKMDRLPAFDTVRAKSICHSQQVDNISSLMPIREQLCSCFSNLLREDYYFYDFVYSNNSFCLPYAIIISYENSNRNLSNIIVEFINTIASNIRLELSSVSTKLSEYATKSILQIYRHEIIHQVLALTTSIKLFNPEENAYLSQEKIAHIYRDCSACLSELSFMTNNIKLFTSHSNVSLYGFGEACEFRTIDIFKDVINKHVAMHRELRESKNLWFEVTGRAETSHHLYCQPMLLDLLLFNIVSNAVKYAYDGSKIWFDYSSEGEKYQSQTLAIRNYGCSVQSGINIYRLYYRGPDNAYAETGSGIGLYISKRLSEIMGIKLYHRCRLVSKYNVPLMRKYLDLCNDGVLKENAPDPDEVLQEMKRLQNEKRYNQIVNSSPSQDEDELCIEEVVDKIIHETYEVSFILEI